MMEWVRGKNFSALYDNGICMLCIYGFNGMYHVLLEAVDSQYHVVADSMEYAEWDAVNNLYNKCNYKANYYHKIRDHLPSIRDLAEKAGITTEDIGA